MALMYSKYKGILIEDALDMPLSVLLVNFAIEANKRAEEQYARWKDLPAKEKAKYGEVKDKVFIFLRDAKVKA